MAPLVEREIVHTLKAVVMVVPMVVVQTLEVEPIRGLEVALDHAASMERERQPKDSGFHGRRCDGR